MVEDIFETGLEDESNIEGLLNNYKKYLARISTLKSAIYNTSKYTELDAPISNYNPMPGKTGMKDCAMESYVCKVDEIITNFEAKKKEYEDKIDSIDKLIEILKPRNRKIIRGFYIDKITLQEIADNENFDINTIKIAKRSSLKKLQKELDDQNKLIFTLKLHQSYLNMVKNGGII